MIFSVMFRFLWCNGKTVVSRILFSMLFVSFSYCGVCSEFLRSNIQNISGCPIESNLKMGQLKLTRSTSDRTHSRIREEIKSFLAVWNIFHNTKMTRKALKIYCGDYSVNFDRTEHGIYEYFVDISLTVVHVTTLLTVTESLSCRTL